MKKPTETSRVETASEDMARTEVERLSAIFPQFVKDGVVDFDAFREFFGEEGVLAEAGQERYGLSWKGKSDAFKAIRVSATGTLTPQEEESKNWDTTENVFIEGDNLEALKLLQRHYRSKIKMIYIDPPYNTGKDFIYKDNFTENKSDYYERTGQYEGGVALTSNPASAGRYHSDWLTMMYPRLFLARQLLRDDGVIFISIDDNEVANLRLIMDEIFGEENFIGTMIRKSKIGGGSDSRYIVKEHEYLIAYSRAVAELPEMFTPHNEDYLKRYKEEDGEGRFFWDTFARPGLKNPINYDITAPDGSIINGDWIRSKDRFEDDLEEGRMRFLSKSDGEWSVQFKQYLNEDGKKPRSFSSDLGSTIDGKNDIKGLFDNAKIFPYPKPVKLVGFLANIVTSDDDLILDFFAGSGTTANAVMVQNEKDGGNRKWISIQIPEEIDPNSEAYKASYQTIAEISRERIRRAGEKIQKGDTGFKSYKLSQSNYRQWQTLGENTTEEELKEQMKMFIDQPLVDSYSERDVMNEITLKEGYSLNVNIESGIDKEKGEIGRVHFWTATEGDRLLVAIFASKIQEAEIDQIATMTGLTKQDSHTLVTLDSALTDSTKLNLARNFNLKVI